MKKAKFLLPVIFIILIALFLVVYFAMRPDLQDGSKTITVEVSFKDEVYPDGYHNIATIETDAEYLLEAINGSKDIHVLGEEGAYGLYVTTVDGRKADEDQEEWWCITKNDGEQVNTGISETPIADGDKYEFTLKKGW